MSTETAEAPKPKMGRPRKLKPMDEVVPAVEPAEKKVVSHGGFDIKPFTNSAELPKSIVSTSGKKRRVVAGEPRYATRTTGNVVEVIAVYRNGKGVGRRLVRALKPSTKPSDRALLAKLRKAGVPEI